MTADTAAPLVEALKSIASGEAWGRGIEVAGKALAAYCKGGALPTSQAEKINIPAASEYDGGRP